MEKTFSSSKLVEHRPSSNGGIVVKPYTGSEKEVVPKCRKNVGHYKIMIHRTWAGNGFGHDSLIFVWDTKTDIVRLVRGTYSDTVRMLAD